MVLTIIIGLIIAPLLIGELIYFNDKSILRILSMGLLFIGNICFDYMIKAYKAENFKIAILLGFSAIILIVSSMYICLYLLGYII